MHLGFDWAPSNIIIFNESQEDTIAQTEIECKNVHSEPDQINKLEYEDEGTITKDMINHQEEDMEIHTEEIMVTKL